MFIDDRIEQIAFQLQEELENTREKLKAAQDENAKLKTTIDLYRKADAEKTEKIANLAAKVRRLNEELNSLKEDEGWLKYRLSIRDAINTTIDQLKNNSSTVSYSELLAMHTADIETINKLNIRGLDVKKKVQQLKDIINDLSEEL